MVVVDNPHKFVIPPPLVHPGLHLIKKVSVSWDDGLKIDTKEIGSDSSSSSSRGAIPLPSPWRWSPTLTLAIKH